MDNVKFHRTEAINDFFKSNNFNCQYLTPFSTESNPIKNFVIKLKSIVIKANFSIK